MSASYFGSNQVSKQLFNQQLVDSPPPFIAIDVETVSLEERLPVGFAVTTSPTDTWYFKVLPEADREIELLHPLLNNPAVKKVFQNAFFDLRALPIALPDMSVDTSNVADTLVMARLLGRANTKLVELAPEVGCFIRTADDLMKEYGAKNMLGVPQEEVAAMCASHASATLKLFFHFLPDIDTDYFNVEMAAIPILIDMSQRGMKLDKVAVAKEEARLEEETQYYKKICADYDLSPGSPMQVGYILAKNGVRLPIKKVMNKRTGVWEYKYKTDKKILQFVDHPLAAAILNYRQASTLLTRYIRPLKDLDRLYTNYSFDTSVGRTASSGGGEEDKTNLQNWPPELRYIIVPDSGTYTHGDFSQEHLRILMHFSGDRRMQEIYSQPPLLEDGQKNPEGDIHFITAKELNIPRQIAKKVNFGIPYGATAEVIRDNTGITNLRVCQRFLDEWLETYPDAAEWLHGAKEYARQNGKTLPTLFNRQIVIQEEWTAQGKLNQEAMDRKAVNFPILGSDGEVMKRALIICAAKKLPLAVQVHDSIDCDGDVEFPKEQLETIAPVYIPFETEKNTRWK